MQSSFPSILAILQDYDLYLKSHTLAYARCEVKADDRVMHTLKSKLNWEYQLTRKKNKHGLNRWHEQYERAANEATSDKQELNWPKVKKILKDLAAKNRLEYWREYIKPLVQQGNMLKLIHLENMDLTWKSIIFEFSASLFGPRLTISPPLVT